MSAVKDLKHTLHFNKYAWEEHYDVAAGDGDVGWKTARLVMKLRKTSGTAAPDCHIPLVWRRDSTLAELCGMSPKTYRGLRDELIECGYLFEIASGKGHRQTIKVLKLPAWSELEALDVAKRAFDAWCERTGTRHLKWISRALDKARWDRKVSESAELDVDKGDPTEQTVSPPQANGKSSRLPLYNKEKTTFVGEEGSQTEQNCDSGATNPALHPEKKSSVGDEVVDFERIKVLKLALLELFSECGRLLDEGVAIKLARAYGRRGACEDALRETLEAKLLRLFADGFGPGQVARFLLEDAPEWTPPAPPSPTSMRPKTASGEAPKAQPMHPFYARIHQLEQSGVGYFDAVSQAEDEFGGLPAELV